MSEDDNESKFDLLSVAKDNKVLDRTRFGILHTKWTEEGSKEAYDRMVKSNIKLVMKLAKKTLPEHGILEDDLIQVGMIGLMRAIEKFEPDFGFAFSTYASNWIREAMEMEINKHKSNIRIPTYRIREIKKYNSTLSKLPPEHQNIDGIYNRLTEEGYTIAGGQQVTKERIKFIFDIESETKCYSTDVPFQFDNGSIGEDFLSFQNPYIEDYFESEIEEQIHKEKLNKILEEILLEKFDKRTSEIIMKRFGLIGGKEYTLEEVGKDVGLTKERVRQIETETLRKLRWALKKRGIKLKDK